MKARKILYLAIVATILSLAIALPALADDPEPVPVTMWVQRIQMIRTGRSPKGSDRVGAMIHVLDANGEPVVDATVTTEWALPDGSTLEAEKLTCIQGVAAVFVPLDGPGDYTVCVLNVVKEGWLYDPSLNPDEECSSIYVW